VPTPTACTFRARTRHPTAAEAGEPPPAGHEDLSMPLAGAVVIFPLIPIRCSSTTDNGLASGSRASARTAFGSRGLSCRPSMSMMTSEGQPALRVRATRQVCEGIGFDATFRSQHSALPMAGDGSEAMTKTPTINIGPEA
jgi:hypothetical protein